MQSGDVVNALRLCRGLVTDGCEKCAYRVMDCCADNLMEDVARMIEELDERVAIMGEMKD